MCRVSDKTGEPDRFTIQVPLYQVLGPDAYRRDGRYIHNYEEVGERVYEIRAPSKELAQMWIAEISKRRNPVTFFMRSPTDYDAFMAWISNADNTGKAIPEEHFKLSCKFVDDNAYDLLSHKDHVEFAGPNYRYTTNVLFFYDNAGAVWDSRGKYYPGEYFALYGMMPPDNMSHENQRDFKHRPYPTAEFEPPGETFDRDEVALYKGGYEYFSLTTEEWLIKYQWPLRRAHRKEIKLARGVPLLPDDLTPPPTPPRDDDDDYGSDGGGGYGSGGDAGYDDYDTPIGADEPETAYVAPVGMSAEERRQKELQHKVDQWERQCRQIESANNSMKDKFERAMNDYERKHKEWEATTKIKCSSCKGATTTPCGQCKGSGRGTTGKECLTCRGKANFNCLHCSSHKGLDYGPKGKYAEPKPPSKPNYKDLPRKPT